MASLRKYTITHKNGRRDFGVLAPGVIVARIQHNDSGIIFTVKISITKDLGSMKAQSIMSRTESGGGEFKNLLGFYMKKHGLSDKSSEIEINTIYRILALDLQGDLDTIINLVK